MTPSSLRALLAAAVDYAGLFPPAKLDMDTTVRNYAGYIAGEDEWMLGRLIVPVTRLEEFIAAARKEIKAQPAAWDDGPWQISALTAAADDAGALEKDLKRIAAFNEKHGVDAGGDGLGVIDVIEMRAGNTEAIDRALDLVPSDLFPFFEIAVDTDPRGLIACLADGEAGAKVRTGGETAEKYPSAGALGRFIMACSRARVPWKATAGMHHPLRHKSPERKTMEHGFINVFLAGCMAASGAVTEDAALVSLLDDVRAEAFEFKEESITWEKRRITLAQVEKSRETIALSFGSCSFDEPREDLRAMRLM